MVIFWISLDLFEYVELWETDKCHVSKTGLYKFSLFPASIVLVHIFLLFFAM